ncbi:DUF2384 domain-containing protein [Colwellia sp. M166]|nr:DUF2384 domain-containing protein [Colwellia sp. M166]
MSTWLCSPRIDFDGKTAIELVDTLEGIQVIDNFFLRLKTGDFS